MSNHVCDLPTQTFFEFKKEYYDAFNQSACWYLGQSFVTRFVPQVDGWFFHDDLLTDIWECKDDIAVEELIYRFICNNNWDYLCLKPVKNAY